MGQNINIKSRVDYNKISGLNFVVPEQLTTSVLAPANGQITYENSILKIYNGAMSRWEPLGQGAMVLKGTVYKPASAYPGGTLPPGYIEDLPDTPMVGDAYMVGRDNYYGPTTTQQYAQIRDMFICIKEKDTTTSPETPAVWTLVPSGNGRFVDYFDKNKAKTGTDDKVYEFEHALGTQEVVVKVYEQIYDDPTSATKKLLEENEILVSTTLVAGDATVTPATNDKVVLTFGYSLPATEFYKIVIIAG